MKRDLPFTPLPKLFCMYLWESKGMIFKTLASHILCLVSMVWWQRAVPGMR